jgi:hypothetical protein
MDSTKIILSAGFWITLVVFIALGYAFGDEQSVTPSSAPQYRSQTFENDVRTSDSAARSSCAPATARGADPMFPQVSNWQRGGSMYAPGLSLTLTSKPRHLTLCPGPVEIPQTLTQ